MRCSVVSWPAGGIRFHGERRGEQCVEAVDKVGNDGEEGFVEGAVEVGRHVVEFFCGGEGVFKLVFFVCLQQEVEPTAVEVDFVYCR